MDDFIDVLAMLIILVILAWPLMLFLGAVGIQVSYLLTLVGLILARFTFRIIFKG